MKRLITITALALALAGQTLAQPTWNNISRTVVTDTNSFLGTNSGPAFVSANGLPLSVFLKGAKGDGVSDDTAAIQAAIDSLPVSSYYNTPAGEIYLPPGTYKITSPIKIYNGVTLRGAGKFASKIKNLAQDDSIKIIFNTNSINSVVRITDLHIEGVDDATNGAAINCKLVNMNNWAPYPIIERIRIWYHYDGVQFQNTVCGEVKDVMVRAATRHGFFSDGSMNAVLFTRAYPAYCGSHGFFFNSGNYNSLISCASEFNGGDGFRFERIDGTDNKSFSSSMTSCGAEHNQGNGFTLFRSKGGTLVNCYANANSSNGFSLHGGYGVTFVGGSADIDGEYSINLGTDELGQEAMGVTIIGMPYLSGGLGQISHPEKVIRFESGYGRALRLGYGDAGHELNYSSGGYSIGSLTTNPYGFEHYGTTPRLYLRSTYGPSTNYHAELKVNYAAHSPVQLIGASDIELLRQAVNFSEELIALPLAAPRGGMAGGFRVGYTNAWAAFAVNGGASFGCTNDPGTGSIIVTNEVRFAQGGRAPRVLTYSGSWDPEEVANGAVLTNTVAIDGALLGESAIVTFPLKVSGLFAGNGVAVSAFCTENGSVRVTLTNNSGESKNFDQAPLTVFILR